MSHRIRMEKEKKENNIPWRRRVEDEEWWWFSLFSPKEKPLANDPNGNKNCFPQVSQKHWGDDVTHTRIQAHPASKMIIILQMYDFPLSLFLLIHNMLSHQLCVCFYVRAQCLARDCHCHSFGQPTAAWVNVFCGEAYIHSNNWYWSGSVEHWCHCASSSLSRPIQICEQKRTEPPQLFEIWERVLELKAINLFCVRYATSRHILMCADVQLLYSPSSFQEEYFSETRNELANSALAALSTRSDIRTHTSVREYLLNKRFSHTVCEKDLFFWLIRQQQRVCTLCTAAFASIAS